MEQSEPCGPAEGPERVDETLEALVALAGRLLADPQWGRATAAALLAIAGLAAAGHPRRPAASDEGGRE